MNLVKYLAIPYKPSESSFKGCDCFGLVKLWFETERGIAINTPDYTHDWYKSEPKRISKEYSKYGFKRVKDIKPGDVLVLIDEGFPRHLGIVISEESFLHTTVRGTACHSFVQGPWSDKISMVLRYKGKRNDN
jgi:cell wall-associated NlpC family hydrolase